MLRQAAACPVLHSPSETPPIMALFLGHGISCMGINLNNPRDLNFANVRALLASGRDDIDLEVRVTEDGIVVLSEVTGPKDMDGICFRIGDMNTTAHAREFIGPNAEAVTDEGLVDQVLRTIEKNWGNRPASGVADLEAYRMG